MELLNHLDLQQVSGGGAGGVIAGAGAAVAGAVIGGVVRGPPGAIAGFYLGAIGGYGAAEVRYPGFDAKCRHLQRILL